MKILALLLMIWWVSIPALGDPPALLPSAAFGPRLHPTVPAEEVVLKFGFIGCNRLPTEDARRQKGARPDLTANFGELSQTALDLNKLQADFLVLGGDFVMNEAPDHFTLSRQLAAWSEAWNSLGVELPLYFIPGNHEMICKKEGVPMPNPAAGDQYRAWLAANELYNRGIQPGPTPQSQYPGVEDDALVDDQSRLSYYLDVPTPDLRDPRFPKARVIRLIALNTDTLTSKPPTDKAFNGTGEAPWNWLASVVREAEADELIGGVIVMAHRPISRIGGEEMEMAPPANQKVYEILSSAVASSQNPGGKVRAYLCAHAHMHDVSQLTGPPAGFSQQNSLSGENLGLFQIVAGCCGSPLERRWAEHPTWGPGLPHLGFPDPEQEGLLRPYFGFQFVTIQTDGTTEITNFARPFGDNYSRENYVLGETVPAVPLSSVVVYPERAK